MYKNLEKVLDNKPSQFDRDKFVDIFRLTHWDIVVVLIRNSGFCKVGQWVSYFTTFATQFTLCLFTFDRFLAIYKPMFYKQCLKDTLWYPVVATSVNFLLTAVLLSGNLLVFDLENGACVISSALSKTIQTFYFHYSVTFLYCGLPATLLFLLNAAIIYKIRRLADSVSNFLSWRRLMKRPSSTVLDR